MPELHSTASIQWHSWNTVTCARARDEDKLLLIYCHDSLDHWSQRWLREIQLHAALVESINECCVPVMMRIDQDIDIAARAQEALAVCADASGWPAIMWLTPELHPLGATPYRPIEDGQQMRGLAPMFIDIMQAWLQQREALEADVRDMRLAWQHMHSFFNAEKIPGLARCLDQAEAHIMNLADNIEGGFGTAPRQLHSSWLGFLLRRVRSDNAAPALREQLSKTLNAMLAGGVYDHLHGGFFHAASDSSWNVPFFEKRALDQVQMIEVLCLAAQELEQPVYQEAAQQCYDFLVHALRCDHGHCAWGLHAESMGAGGKLINGAAYVWSYRQLQDTLGEQGAAIVQKRFIADERCFIDEDFACLAIRDELHVEERAALPALCRRLAQARSERPQPQRDERCNWYLQAQLLRLHSLPIVQGLELSREWPEQLVGLLRSAHLSNSAEEAAAALAMQAYADTDDRVQQWIAAQAETLQQCRGEHGSLPLMTESVLPDPLSAGPDTSEYQSPVADLYRFFSALPTYRDAADDLLQAYLPAISAAPLAHTGLLCAACDCQHH